MVQSNSLAPKMADAYTAYATQVSDALQTLLETTGVKIEPPVEFVSCGEGLNEHFVPKASLERHLWKCHGKRRPAVVNNAAFYYGSRKGENAVSTESSGDLAEEGAVEVTGLQSLVEREADGQEDQGGVVAAIQSSAASAAAFYQQVQAWTRIPKAFDTIKDEERQLVASSSLHRWLNAELGRPGVLPSGDALDEELVQYIAGLLDHPDFCQPDLLALELHEFLGNNVTNIVLALWKFMIVEIGLHSVFKLEKSETSNKIQVNSSVTSQDPAPAVPTNSQPDATTERDYKRRRASYRGKVGTKTGPAAYREMIQKHMVGLSLDMDRELILGGGFREDKGGSESSKARPTRRKAVDWRNFTDALEVRNRSRQRRQDSTKGLSRSRSRSRGRYSTNDNARRQSYTSPERRRDSSRHRRSKSRSRRRSPRRQDRNDSRHRRRRSLSKDRGRDRH
ncbi:hypothetical protein PPTG_00956 [Phytophthora nicotianae INRA-310]|uniref:PWI domain-containing protein n=1 Tax=Phytophthora nicotianae (strain INRA-310) TaxID=761204 RepID=W2RJF6_PHYN3|nr:hypothetical protein PPTG_00956 [Phytophthora nicotianae INRA-310]ETN24745.1 hypothetical protein PPTG_00956 [Phytophthora nicotianae INRA-310]